MIFVVLFGIIAILATGGGIFQILLYLAIVGTLSASYTDRNRREGWWK